MAPKKSLKRSEAEDAQQPLAKKLAKGPAPEDIPVVCKQMFKAMDMVKYRPVLDAVDHPLADDMPQACRQMLKAMVLSSLGVLAGERHPQQEMVVEMLGEVINGIESSMQNASAAAEARIAEIDASRPGLDAEVVDADTALAAATAAEDGKKAAHDLSSQRAREAKTAVSDLQSAARSNEASHRSVSKAKETLEQLLVCHVQYLKDKEDGSWDAAEMKKHAKEAIAACKKLPLEDSLANSISATVAKRPSERNSLDSLVFQQLEAYIKGRLEELDASLRALTPELAKHAVNSERAREELEEKSAAAQLTASELKAVKAASKIAVQARTLAASAVESYGPTRDLALEARDLSLAKLVAFRQGAVRCYREAADQKPEFANAAAGDAAEASEDTPIADRNP